MATVSSMLKLIDGFSRPIQKSIHAMDKLTDAMEKMNRSAKIPNMEQTFAGVRDDINAAKIAVDKMADGLEQVDDAAQSVDRATSRFGGLSKAIIVANQGLQLLRSAWQGVETIGNRADERISVDARLGLINDGTRTQEQLEARVMQAASRTRAEYEATANLVAKMGRQDYFAENNEKAVAFAETINKGMVVSGATANEATNAILQLSQGLASGVLRGDEFRSIMENAPILAEMMTKSMGITKGALRELSEEGALTTEVVVSSIMAQADALDEQFGSMPVTFGQATTAFNNKISLLMDKLSQPGQAIDKFIKKIQQLVEWLDTPKGTALIDGIAGGLTAVVDLLFWVFGLVGDVYQFFVTYWPIISPIVFGIAAALAVYYGWMLLCKGAAIVYAGAQAALNIAKMIAVPLYAAATGATMAETAAQWGLNTALYSCPLVWIIILIIALIAIIYAVVGAINHFAGTSISATGVIAAAFYTLAAHVYNSFVVPSWNAIAAFVNFFYNVWNDPIASVKILFYDLAITVIGYIRTMANAIETLINKIPGVQIDITSGLDGFYSQLESARQKVKDESGWKELVGGLDYWEYEDAAKAGYAMGEAIDEKVSGLLNFDDLFKGDNIPNPEDYKQEPQNWGSAYQDIEPTGGKLDSVDKINSDVDISNQSLEYLRDIAEMNALRSFEAYTAITYNQMDELRLSPEDADALKNSAGSETNIYYLNYSGQVHVQNDIKRGESWDEIKEQVREETEAEIETGFSGVEEVVYA